MFSLFFFVFQQLSSVQSQMHSKGGYSGETSAGATPGGIDLRNSQVWTGKGGVGIL